MQLSTIVFIFALAVNVISGDNWAVLVDTSRYWFNYRHSANVLGIYRSIKRLGIPDSRIIMMIPDDVACNARNPLPGVVRHDTHRRVNLYGNNIEVDYRGYEVTPQNFIRVLTDRLPDSVPSSKRLNSNEHSNILIYMTGHGGDSFIKFQDDNEMSSQDLADAFEQMWVMKRYKEILFIADTCQAETLGTLTYSPNIITVGSSRKGEDSFSHQMDANIGVYVSDRFSYYALEFLSQIGPESKAVLHDLLHVCPPSVCISTTAIHTHRYQRDLRKVLVTEFFGSNRQVRSLAHYAFNSSSTPDLLANAEQFESKVAERPRQLTDDYAWKFVSQLDG